MYGRQPYRSIENNSAYRIRRKMREVLHRLLDHVSMLLSAVCSFFSALFSVDSGGGVRNPSTLTFENGTTIRVGALLAEGGFSLVYSATDYRKNRGKKNTFALKRIYCGDSKAIVAACRTEASVHAQFCHDSLMPLLGISFHGSCCYMLFPYLPHSLRKELDRRNILSSHRQQQPRQLRSFSDEEILRLFSRIVDAVQLMHNQARLVHGDIKVENILLAGNDTNKPVLMDFGSARPLVRHLTTRSSVLDVLEDAATHSTVSYRAPELFECPHGPNEFMDGRTDVWSLGCLLYAMFYGASPFEIEIRQNNTIHIVECGHLRVLGDIPHSTDDRCNGTWKELIAWMLNVDRVERPTINNVATRIDDLRKTVGVGDLEMKRFNSERNRAWP